MSSSEVAAEEFLDLRQLVDKLWRRRWWLLACTLLFAIAAATYALRSERIYRATTILAPAGSGGGKSALNSVLSQVGGLASLAGINVGSSGADTEEALAVLRSRQFTVRFFEADNVVPKIFHNDWDERTRQWKSGVKPPSVSRAFAYFDNDVRTVIQNRKTGLVSLQVEWRNRAEAAQWANELVTRLNEEMRVRAIADANSSLQYLEKELESTAEVATRESINRLIEAQVKQRMLANVNQEYAFRVIDKAIVPDADEPVRPHRRQIIMIGILLGFIFAALAVVIYDYFRQGRA